jgi:hypothetical protein
MALPYNAALQVTHSLSYQCLRTVSLNKYLGPSTYAQA